MEALGTGLCLVGIVLIIGLALLAMAIRIVPEYRRLVVFRLGRCVGSKGPGVVLLIPIVDRATSVDLREQVREIPHQTSITKDNAAISVDFLWYYKVLDPAESVLQVGDFEAAAQGMATTTLRAVIPREIQDAMNRQMSAERNRRAVVTESEGAREAQINVADGEKQAAILRAEGDKQSSILRAEGEREAQLLRAEGFSNALDKIYSVAQGVDQKTMTLQYFEALKAIGMGASTKYIFPMEFTSLLSDFTKGLAGKKGDQE